MVKIYVSWEKYLAKIFFSVIVILIVGFVLSPSVYFQLLGKADFVFAQGVGYGGGDGVDIYCPTIPGQNHTATLSVTNQSVTVGSNVSFTINTSNLNSPSYSIADSFSGTSITNSNLSSNTFNWVPTKNDAGEHNLSILVKDSCNNINLVAKITVISPKPFVPKFPNTGIELRIQ